MPVLRRDAQAEDGLGEEGVDEGSEGAAVRDAEGAVLGIVSMMVIGKCCGLEMKGAGGFDRRF